MDRRAFLKLIGAAGGAAAAGGLLRPPRARAKLWGDFPAGAAQAAILPEGVAAKRVLEIFLYGGLCPWETFYTVPAYGKPDDPLYPNEQFYALQAGADSVSAVAAACGILPAGAPLTEPFALDELGAQVHLGPFVAALRARKDLTDRLRVTVLRHALEPHEAAIPLALSGRPLGNPKLSGAGAAINQYFQARATEPAPAPFAYVLYPTGVFPTDNLRAASSVGFMPASTRPLAIKLEQGSTLGQTLARPAVGVLRPEHDALVKHYALRHRARMTRPGGAAPVRSAALQDYGFALDTLQGTDKLAQLLAPEVLASQAGESCGEASNLDTPAMGMKLAAYLLTRPVDAPRYVCLVDGGLIPASGGGGYDTHDHHNVDSLRNLHHTLGLLAGVVNEPGEGDPDKLDLDDTLILLTTEFGRTPYAQNGDGRNHHPYGYVTAMIGGPIGPDQRGIVGAIGPDSVASTWLTPAEMRASMLVAMGIWPFEPDAWAVGDIRAAASEADGAMWLKEIALGHAS